MIISNDEKSILLNGEPILKKDRTSPKSEFISKRESAFFSDSKEEISNLEKHVDNIERNKNKYIYGRLKDKLI